MRKRPSFWRTTFVGLLCWPIEAARKKIDDRERRARDQRDRLKRLDDQRRKTEGRRR